MAKLAKSTRVWLEVGDDVVPGRDEETGEPMTRRIWLVAARGEFSTRYWPDFVHEHTFTSEEAAARFVDRVEAALADRDGLVPWARLESSPHWHRNTAPDPLESLKPYGEEWAHEEEERAFGRGW